MNYGALGRSSLGRWGAHRWFIAAIVVQVLACSGALWSQEPDAFDALIEVPVPALDKFEQAIQDQLMEQRASLDGLVSRTDVPRLELMESFGKTGQLYFLYELYEAAQACFINARTLAPRDFRWHYYIGVVYSRQGEAAKAIDSLEQAIPLRPQSIPAHMRLGLLEFDHGDLDRAEPEFLAALEIKSDLAAAHHGLGMVALRRGDPQMAIQHLERALELQPKATTIHQQLGLAYRELGDLDRARYHLQLNEHDLVMFPDPLVFRLSGLIQGSRFYIKLGNEALKAGRLGQAIDDFSEAVARDPEEKLAQYNLGQALLQAQRVDEAIQHFERALDIDPDFRDAHYNLGTALSELERFEESAAHFQRAREIDPQDREARLQWAMAMGRAGKAREAVEQLQELRAENPDDAGVALSLAAILGPVGQVDAARAELDRALSIAREPALEAEAHFQLGLLDQGEGATASAIDHFRTAGELNPKLSAANTAAGALQAQQGAFDEAAESFERVVEADPTNQIARFSRAMALVLAGNYQLATDELEQDLEILPQSLPLRHLLARMLATVPDESVRDGDRALVLAKEVFGLAVNADHAETLAMAWAESGDFDTAIQWQERALELLPEGGHPGRASAARLRLEQYQNGQACREPWKG
ncbi:MAG: tetratricopeptide repeat protein [Thermoanaerobaculia bacterium]